MTRRMCAYYISTDERKVEDGIDWTALAYCLALADERDSWPLIELNASKVYWAELRSIPIPEAFLRAHIELFERYDHKAWTAIPLYQTLSDSFLEDFSDRISWRAVSVWQEMTPTRLVKFKDRIYWNEVIDTGYPRPDAVVNALITIARNGDPPPISTRLFPFVKRIFDTYSPDGTADMDTDTNTALEGSD